MSQLGELLNKLATQSGVDANDESLKALLSNPTIASYDVPDAIASSITSNLMTVESAKNNPVLKNHFFATALNGVDSEISNLTSELGLDQVIIDELNLEKSSTKRAALLVRKVKELESAKANKGSGDKSALQIEIDKLHNEIKTIKDEHAAELSTQSQASRENIKSLIENNLLNGYDYSLPTSKDVSISTAKHILANKMAEKGIKVVLNDNNQLELQNADGMAYFNGNEKIDYKTFAESTLAENKLLKTVQTPGAPPSLLPTPTPGAAGSNEFLAAATKAAEQFKS